MKTRATLALAVCLLALTARADDWPQFGGPNRDGVSKEKGLLKTWPNGGPKLLWTYKDAGVGFSGPAIVGDRLYLSGARGGDEYVFALDLTGKEPREVWKRKLGPKFTWKGNSWNEGPIATPTVVGDLVFALSGGGELVCVNAMTGAEQWRTNLLKDLKGDVYNFGGSAPAGAGWGFAGAPLVDGDKVICVPGGKDGTLAALEKSTGKVLWRSKGLTDEATYASPVMAVIGGVKQYLQLTTSGVAAVDSDGNLLWYYKRAKPFEDILGTSPLVKGDRVFISGAGGNAGGCDLIEVTSAAGKFTATKVYASKELANYHGGVVLVGDYVYGASGEAQRSKWVCMEFLTGTVKWSVESRKLGKGSVTAADGFLYCLGEMDLVVHTPASPDQKLAATESFALPETSKLRRPSGKSWTHPVIANGKLYLRDQELLYCYEVK